MPPSGPERSFDELPTKRPPPSGFPHGFRPLPVLLLRRGDVRPRALESLCDDPRFELLQVRQLSPEWRSVANHVAAIFIAPEREPLGALTYALTAGLSGPIVMLLPKRLMRESDDLIAAGVLACVTLPASKPDRDRLARSLRTRSSLARVDITLRLMLDPISRTVRYGRRSVTLSQREFALLYCLSTSSGRPMPADELMRRVWHNARLDSRQRLDVYIYQLRRKLGQLGLRGAIETVRGYGYALSAGKRATRGPRHRRA